MTRAKVVDGLTKQEHAFVEALLGVAEGNATEAAALAKYKARDREKLGDLARKLTKKPHIKAALEDRARADPLVLDRVAIRQLWTKMALGTEKMEVLAEGRRVKVATPPMARVKASELLAKSLRMFGEETGGKTDTVVIILPDNGRQVAESAITIDLPKEQE